MTSPFVALIEAGSVADASGWDYSWLDGLRTATLRIESHDAHSTRHLIEARKP